MCVMRREKLQQLQEGEAKTKPSTTEQENTIVTEIQPSTKLGNGGTVRQTVEKESEKSDLGDLSQLGINAANILKNVGLKNITIAPIPPKTSTITQVTSITSIASPTLLVTTPMKLPQFGQSVTTDSVLTNVTSPVVSSPASAAMPKIPKSLTVIPQTVAAVNPTQVSTNVGTNASPNEPLAP